MLVEHRDEVLATLAELKGRTFDEPEKTARVRLRLTTAAATTVADVTTAMATSPPAAAANDGVQAGPPHFGTRVETAPALPALAVPVVGASLSVQVDDCSAAVVEWFESLSARLEAFHLPLECEKDETWGSRLLIVKKGGGFHFSAEEQELLTYLLTYVLTYLLTYLLTYFGGWATQTSGSRAASTAARPPTPLLTHWACSST